MKKDMLIVVPYRNREKDLKKFLEKTPEYFNKQNLSYDILICELDQKCSWNAGMPCNSLIDFIEDKEYEWLYVHHVDITPIEGEWKFPNENEAYHNLGDYGSCLMKMKTFLDVGGYSNSFWGWGAEDNDLYDKLRKKGYKVITLDDSYQVKYDKEYQNHARNFDGICYANNLRVLYNTPEKQKNNITNYHEHAETKNLVKIQDNIYKQLVIPKKLCPNSYKNNKVIFSYLKNQKDPKNLMVFVKSAMMLSSYSFDLNICIADEIPDEWLLNQLNAFGCKVFHHKIQHDNIFIDRYHAYKNFLLQNTQYEKVLHVDCLDSFFQNDPFEFIDNNLIITSEDVLLKDEKWNENIFKGIYDYSFFDSIKNNNVLCCGIIGGPTEKFLVLCDKIIEESKKVNINGNYGWDQPILQKLIYLDKFEIDVKNLNDGFCCNLHVYFHNKEKFKNQIKINNDSKFFNENNKKFSIVHQYNRDITVYSKIYNHFNNYYYPIF
jgi:hypothetical protein